MARPRRVEVGVKPKSPGASRGSLLCLGYARIRVRGQILLRRKRDQRLELVTARFAFPQMPNAVPVQILRPFRQEDRLPALGTVIQQPGLNVFSGASAIAAVMKQK